MADRFPVFIGRILSTEGGYTNDRRDPGNWTGGHVGAGTLKGTKFGIAANTYPTLDIKHLTREKAIEIYRRDFWAAVGADALPPALGFQMLDAAVNHGIGTAKRMLQGAAGVAPDGVVGPATRAAIAAAEPADLLLQFFATRVDYYTRLRTFDTYGRGWMRRMVANLRYAAQDN
jgi:lysozyme family protein